MSKHKHQHTDKNKWQTFAEEEARREQTNDAGTKQADDTAAEQTEGELGFPDRAHLEDQLTAMEQQVFELKDKLTRLQAEQDNQHRRHERQIENAHKFANEKLLTELLPVMDSLERGLEGTDNNDPQVANMRKGIELTLGMFEKMLKKFGMEVIAPQPGDAFDPAKEEAVSMQANPEFKSNTVIQVLQKGYALNGRVLRAAMVIVAQ